MSKRNPLNVTQTGTKSQTNTKKVLQQILNSLTSYFGNLYFLTKLLFIRQWVLTSQICWVCKNMKHIIVGCGLPFRGNRLLNLHIIHFCVGFWTLFRKKNVANFYIHKLQTYCTMADKVGILADKIRNNYIMIKFVFIFSTKQIIQYEQIMNYTSNEQLVQKH